ncbi:hypothetical protein VSP9026_00307 [Vibrio spartinae]|uniref:Leucine rich repeat variant n=2 Tax=Vibrio spartinae TaxID=1918945 RepID=A0A1N6LZS5_9VIBR|nr:hypothetical protein VSP9026_00307 [Vibrio spartinae]
MIHSAKEFIRLRGSSEPDDYMRAGTEEAPLDVWMEVIEKNKDMRVWVARNRAIPTEIIRKLAYDNDDLVRHAIASKYPLEEELYILFSKDPDEGVRNRIACNKRTPSYILKEMADSDSSDYIKENALEKYNERLRKEHSK